MNVLRTERSLEQALSRVSASCRDMLDACIESRHLAAAVFGAGHHSPSQGPGLSGLDVEDGGWKK